MGARAREQGAGRTGCLVVPALFGAAIGVLLLWWHEHQVLGTALVLNKREAAALTRVPDAAWSREFELQLRYQVEPGDSVTRWVTVSEPQYDAVALGATVAIRYLEPMPAFAALDAPGAASWRETLDAIGVGRSDHYGLPWFAASVVAMLALRRFGRPAIVVVAVAMGLTALMLFFRLPDARPIPPVVTLAQAQRVTRVDAAWGHWRGGHSWYARHVAFLDVPYEVVEFSFVPAGRREVVMAVDAIDAGSLPGLQAGITLPVRYDPAAPRAAQLDGATRKFRAANRLAWWPVPFFGFAIVVVPAWAADALRRRRLRARET